MEISVLIVDDDVLKLGKINETLLQCGVPSNRIRRALTVAEAVEELENARLDLMLLDINLPRRLGEAPQRGGGILVLKELSRTPGLHRPRYIVGITAYEDVIAEFGDQFTEKLWSVVRYSETSDHWSSQVKSKVEYVRAVRASDNFSDGKTHGIDLAIVCALEGVELGAIKRLDCAWQPLRLPHDQTRYLTGTIVRDERSISVVAAAAPRMGMPASAVLTGKIISAFRPRYIAMVGICAGRHEKVGIGDIIVADPSWDWGSGKIDSKDDKPRFRPSPHQLDLDVDLRSRISEACADVALLARIKQRARGPKPSSDLNAHVGPLASGAVVVADETVFEELLDKNRDTLGLEMEAYGVAAACMGFGKPRPNPIIMKAVCDFADKDKDDDYQEYAADTSALLLFELAHLIVE